MQFNLAITTPYLVEFWKESRIAKPYEIKLHNITCFINSPFITYNTFVCLFISVTVAFKTGLKHRNMSALKRK